MDKVMLSLTNFASEMEREKADVEEAIRRLRQGIANLNREGRKRLLEAFEIEFDLLLEPVIEKASDREILFNSTHDLVFAAVRRQRSNH